MVGNNKWHVRSNGLNFIIMDQNTNVIAECGKEEHAELICSLVNGGTDGRIPLQVELWHAVNEYAQSCGGDTGMPMSSRSRRESAVVGVETIVRKIQQLAASSLEEHLQFIADQPCELPSDYVSCKETSVCVTEYCLPCYARAALKKEVQLNEHQA